MIQYYRVPEKKGLNKDELLCISQEYELKDAIHNGKILKAKKLQMKNSNVNDDTISILWTINSPLALIAINLSQNFSFITDKSIEHLCQCTNMQNLKSLNLADDCITDEGISKLATSQCMNSLEELILFGNSDITSESMRMLGDSIWTKKLTKIDVHATSVDDQGVSYFVRSPNASKLKELNVSMNWKRITDATVIAIAQSQTCQGIEILNLEDCAVTSNSFENLSQSKNSQNIHTLILNNSIKESNNFINDQLLQYIAYSKDLKHLKILQLRNTQVSSKGLRTLAASLSGQFLQTLRLSYCKNIDDDILISLKTLMGYQSFKKIYLNNTKVSKQSCEQLQKLYSHVNIVF